MQYDDDIAFQRAILANPADTTLKLVYADWLQDRGDPRAEYVRLQVQLHTQVNTAAAVEAAPQDLAAYQAVFGAVASNCGSCHEAYRM